MGDKAWDGRYPNIGQEQADKVRALLRQVEPGVLYSVHNAGQLRGTEQGKTLITRYENALISGNCEHYSGDRLSVV